MAFEEAAALSPKHPGPQFPRSNAPIICGSLLLHHPLRLTSNIPYEDWPLDGRSRTLRLHVCCKPNFSKPFFVTTLITTNHENIVSDKLEHSTWCWQLPSHHVTMCNRYQLGCPGIWLCISCISWLLSTFPHEKRVFCLQRLGRTRSTVLVWKQKNDRHTQPGLMYIYILREFCKHGFRNL